MNAEAAVAQCVCQRLGMSSLLRTPASATESRLLDNWGLEKGRMGFLLEGSCEKIKLPVIFGCLQF